MQLSIERLRRVLNDGGLYCVESERNKWIIVCENTPKKSGGYNFSQCDIGSENNFKL